MGCTCWSMRFCRLILMPQLVIYAQTMTLLVLIISTSVFLAKIQLFHLAKPLPPARAWAIWTTVQPIGMQATHGFTTMQVLAKKLCKVCMARRKAWAHQRLYLQNSACGNLRRLLLALCY